MKCPVCKSSDLKDFTHFLIVKGNIIKSNNPVTKLLHPGKIENLNGCTVCGVIFSYPNKKIDFII